MFAYEMKKDNTYTFRTLDELDYLIRKTGLAIPVSRDLSPLAKPREIRSGKSLTLRNSVTVHPMEGFDGDSDGSPSELTERRYLRFASSGASLIWGEAAAVCPEGRTSDRQLMITGENCSSYARLIDKVKRINPCPVIAQLTHSGRFSKNSLTDRPLMATHNAEIESRRTGDRDVACVSDDYLRSLPEKYAAEAKAAVRAGFDGVDIKICHQYLLSELLSGFERNGIYGGSFENRTRLIFEILDAVRAEVKPETLICSRFGISDMLPYPSGFGTDRKDPGKPDFTEPFMLLEKLISKGLCAIDMTMGTPYHNPHVNRPYNLGGYAPPEHPLKGVERILNGAKATAERFPGLFIIGTGYSYLREFSPYIAAGALAEGYASAVGFGRMAFAYDTFATDMINGRFDAKKSCIACSKCTQLMRAGSVTGCPIRDQEIYLPIYREKCMNKT